MANRFLNAPTGEAGGLSISQLNTWFAGKDTDDLAQGVLNLYITPAEKAIITSLSTATTAPTPNTIAKRDSSGSSSFYNISAVGMYLRFDNTTEPSINMLDTQGADYSLLTDRNNNIPNLYLRNQNQSGHLHIQGRQQVILNTNNGANLQTASFNSSGLFTIPVINSLSGINCNTTISGAKMTTGGLVVEGQSGFIQASLGISGSTWFVNNFNNDTLYLTGNSVGATNVAIGSATNQPLTFLTNNTARANIDTAGRFNINFSGDTLVGNGEKSNLNIINTNPNNATKTAGMKFWMTDNIGQQKNIGHIYVRTDNANVVNGDLVLANSVVDYETNPSLTCKSDGRVYVNGLTSSGTLVSSSGFITQANISCGFINTISGANFNSNISAVKITTPDLIVNSTLLSNGTAQFIGLISNSGRINELHTNQILPSTAGGLGVADLKIGQYTLAGTNDVYIATGSAGTLDMRADTMLFKGAGNTPQFATFDSSSVRFFRPLITNSGIMTQTISATHITMNNGDLTGFTNCIGSFMECVDLTASGNISGKLISASGLIVAGGGIRTTGTISGGIVNTSGLLASKATILGSTGSVQSIVGISTDTLNINAYTNDTLYMTTNLTTASGLSFGTANSHRLSLLTNNLERVRITGASGFVGINQTAPSQSLDVNGTIIAGQLNISGSGNSWRYEVIGNKTNGSTYTLPSGRWCGELHLQYGNDSGEVGLKKYAFYKAPGATGNGISGQQFYFYRSTTSAESGVGFDTNTGVFTFNLSGTNPSTSASIWYRSGT